jgi:DNA-binding MarR family transcriptional regulator
MAKQTDALDQVLELVVLLSEDMTRSLARGGLSVPRAKLVWLLHHSGPQTQAALAEALKVTPRNVTGLVDGLVSAGYVARAPHPTDRRALLISLTEHGASVLAGMDKAHGELAASLFGGMSRAQLDAFTGGLDHVLGRLREELAA